MDIMKFGIEQLTKHFGGSVSEDGAKNALSGLLGDGKGGLDISAIVSKIAGSGALKDVVGSWLGDGANSSINPGQLMEVFGDDKLASFAGKLGVDKEQATSGLSKVLPSIVDKASTGGSLLDSAGGLGGAMGFAKKLF